MFRVSENHKGQITGVLSPLLRKWRLRKVSKWLTGHSVLDCGCGDAGLAYIISCSMKYTGLDSDEDMIEMLSRSNRKSNREFYEITLPKTSLAFLGKYDNIVLSAVIEHIENPGELLAELRQHLSDRGRMIITAPTTMAKDVLRIGCVLGLFSREAFHQHKWYFTRDRFLQLLRSCELEIEYYQRFEMGFNQIVVARLSTA